MIEINIPGYAAFQFEHLVLDVNGTLAKDGKLIRGVSTALRKLSSEVAIHMITADTHGKQEVIDRLLGLKAVRIPLQDQRKAKLDYIERLGADKVFAIGNGANDADMLARAAVGVAVIGPEAASAESLLRAKVVAPDIGAALELLIHPKRLIATLRR